MDIIGKHPELKMSDHYPNLEQQVAVLKDRVIDLSSQALTPETVNAVIAPTLDDVLGSGRIDVISIGFVLALWSGCPLPPKRHHTRLRAPRALPGGGARGPADGVTAVFRVV